MTSSLAAFGLEARGLLRNYSEVMGPQDRGLGWVFLLSLSMINVSMAAQFR